MVARYRSRSRNTWATDESGAGWGAGAGQKSAFWDERELGIAEGRYLWRRSIRECTDLWLTNAVFSAAIPRIETPRLLLREYREADFEAYAAHHTDPELTAYTIGVLDRRGAWRLFLGNAGSWVVQGLGWWSLEVKASGEYAGVVGAFVRESWPGIEVGWVLLRQHHGKGLATEGARAAIDFAFKARDAQSVHALIAPENHASIAVARRLGMHHESDIDFYGKPSQKHVLHR